MGRGSGGGGRGGGSGSGGGGVVEGAEEARKEMNKPKYRHLLNTEAGADLDWYLRDGFLGINAALRNETVTPEMRDQIKRIDAALEKLPAYKGIAYRAIELSQERMEALSTHVKPGMILDAPSYSSSSVVKSQGTLLGAVNLRIRAKGKAGKAIMQIAKNPHEQEILFKHGTQFKVTGIKKGAHGIGLDIDVTEL